MSPENNIFITGATGFIGAHLVRHFARQGWQVTATGRTAPPPALLDYATYVQADVGLEVPPQPASVVVHAAALASDTADWEALAQSNITGVKRVFEATRHCSCFIYLSSSSVYNNSNRQHAEQDNIDNQLLPPYGRSKRLAEEWLMAQDWSHRTLVILRPRAVYGIGDRVLLPRLLRLVRFGQIISPGDMRVMSSLTHVENLCKVVEACIGITRFGISVYNVADRQPYEMRSVVHRLLSEIYEKPLPFWEIPLKPLKKGAFLWQKIGLSKQFTPYSLAAISEDRVLDVQKMALLPGLLPAVSFWEALPVLGAWVRTNGVERVRRADADLPWCV
jgi:nucleoside-diphosphate-sugar epimerase